MNLQPPFSPIASDEAESAPVEFENPWAWYDEAQAVAESSQAQPHDDSSDAVPAASSSPGDNNDGSDDDDDDNDDDADDDEEASSD